MTTGVEATQSSSFQARPMTPADQERINKLVAKVTVVDQEFTEVDVNDLNTLKQSVLAC